ncbi:hypothetical protein [Halorubrum sp. AJ67]|uniref:hypothetical protein n=1 Tax=Halorubrum sp. AJ67 TaxID=1173487 RepID=UPI0003DDB78E|nr:hypothetical protein [Halorubrum sp. AJ67]CDK39657.1 uncharacterized protein BN903_56 [Halorubrum sp. AJ67]
MANGSRGAPEGNDNAVSHGLFQSRENLRNNLSDREERLLVDVAVDLIERFPDEADVGAYERGAIENIALDTIKRMRANEYILENNFIDETEKSNRANQVYSRIMSDTTAELEKLGLLKEGPALKDAEASEDWMAAISDATDRAGD